jgi:hypothetical protein
MSNPPVDMVGECTDSYVAVEQADGSLEIVIRVPRRFRDLWLIKLTELQATDEELREYAPHLDER